MVLCNYIGIYPGIYVCLLRQTGEGIVKVRFRLTFGHLLLSLSKNSHQVVIIHFSRYCCKSTN